ncbi:MAG TPA: tetratricopeptide repeat protein [Longimicrobiaceae bacterium]|nr:tetratricopeptide repeat protein [Longimicrobiaceae bacterium]
MHFAEAAAIVDPEHPTYAINAGWMCRRAVVYDRAAIWYERGYKLAVRFRHHDLSLSRKESIRALVEHGALLKDQGREDEAREFYELAAKRAARFGRKRQAAVVLHYLLALSAEVGGFEESLDFAQQAFDLYPIQDRQIPALAHDLAFLMVRFAYYSPAITLLELAVSRTYTPELQTLYWGTLARAAAGVRRRERFEEAEQRTLHFIGLYEEYAPAALVNLSEGARSLAEWDLSEQYAGMAVEFARAREDVVVERYALDLLDKIATRELAANEQQPPQADQIRILSRRLVARLHKWKVPGPGEPGTP